MKKKKTVKYLVSKCFNIWEDLSLVFLYERKFKRRFVILRRNFDVHRCREMPNKVTQSFFRNAQWLCMNDYEAVANDKVF